MPNDDLISRADVLDLVQSYGPATYDMPYGSGDMIIRPEDVMALPAVDAAPVIHAKWIYGRNTSATCSHCHRTYYDAYDLDNSDRYCRGCGALMDGE